MSSEGPISPAFRKRFEAAMKRSIFSGRFNVLYLLPIDERRENCKGEFGTRKSQALIEPFHSMIDPDQHPKSNCTLEEKKDFIHMMWRPRIRYAESVRDIERRMRERETWLDRWRQVDVPTLLQRGTSHLETIRSSMDQQAERNWEDGQPTDTTENINLSSKAVLMQYRAMRPRARPTTSIGIREQRSPREKIKRAQLLPRKISPVVSPRRQISMQPISRDVSNMSLPSPSWRPKSSVAMVGRSRTSPEIILREFNVDMSMKVPTDPNYKPPASPSEERFGLMLERRFGKAEDTQSDPATYTLNTEGGKGPIGMMPREKSMGVEKWIEQGKFST